MKGRDAFEKIEVKIKQRRENNMDDPKMCLKKTATCISRSPPPPKGIKGDDKERQRNTDGGRGGWLI